jgi:hypothetical protein
MVSRHKASGVAEGRRENTFFMFGGEFYSLGLPCNGGQAIYLEGRNSTRTFLN